MVLATSAEAALAEFATRGPSFAAVVTDLVMPGIGGRELADRLQQENPALPVPFISGYAADVNAIATGARRRFLAEPFRPSELLGELRTISNDRTGPRAPDTPS